MFDNPARTHSLRGAAREALNSVLGSKKTNSIASPSGISDPTYEAVEDVAPTPVAYPSDSPYGSDVVDKRSAMDMILAENQEENAEDDLTDPFDAEQEGRSADEEPETPIDTELRLPNLHTDTLATDMFGTPIDGNGFEEDDFEEIGEDDAESDPFATPTDESGMPATDDDGFAIPEEERDPFADSDSDLSDFAPIDADDDGVLTNGDSGE